MRLPIDECLPQRVKFLFAEAGHDCQTAREAGLSGKENGELLAAADKKFDVLLTIDKNIRHQQTLYGAEDRRPNYPAGFQRCRRYHPLRNRGTGGQKVANYFAAGTVPLK